ncbi:uncharacterized protein MONOS_4353 [Monocercomonoides exilis]|uniref:uncharacterized protein n=1 Tax=Monocercomonoides exilis TaxID=2049356 RepID=UPI00355A462B|nr:hypothetical protein MONOS_4353 [Monocercomonoides exilis]|eukprot:MONOS_4353.1-p1 / transcript=MONOS_4353.1 / gene=MONOS_4353 / organism=Monocercomonoides_exilis_PA203 / gene_product=unspecified product / transcript_product=unspecified product / location=Mono_scaffold00114:110958-111247(-) / protein_length=75 / sequence_SO=supercontig / SO=protein_coding / is_pseudo=false
MRATCSYVSSGILFLLFLASLAFSIYQEYWPASQTATFVGMFAAFPRNLSFVASSIFLAASALLFTCTQIKEDK